MKGTFPHIILLLALSFVTFFVNNATIYTDIMESRNVITAREMVYDGHWMVPTMNGDLRLEKPPLPTWIAAGAELIAPNDMRVQRGMAGLAATMLVIFCYLFGVALTRNNRFALIAALVLCTSYNIILMGRTASWDIYCHAFMVGAIYFLYQALHQKGAQWGCFIAAGVMLGLSFLSKGPVSFYALLLPFLLAYVICMHAPMKKKGAPLLWMVIVALLVSSWWYIYIYLFHSEAAQAVLQKESTAWVEHNVRPWYYYGTFFLETGIWAILVVFTLLIPYWHRQLRLHWEYLFAVLWMLFMVVLLSLLPEKKTRYLLPVLIPAAYSVAFVLNHWAEAAKGRRWRGFGSVLFLINGWVVAAILVALPVVGYWAFVPKGWIATTDLIWLTPLLLGVAAFIIRSLIIKKPLQFLAGVVALFLVAEGFCMPLIGNVINNPDFKSIRETQQVKALDGLPFYHIKGEDLRIELVYEANRKIRPIDITREASVMQALPCAILTHEPIEKVLPKSLLGKMKVQHIDYYDNNRRPKGSKRYSEQFLYHVTILKAYEPNK